MPRLRNSSSSSLCVWIKNWNMSRVWRPDYQKGQRDERSSCGWLLLRKIRKRETFGLSFKKCCRFDNRVKVFPWTTFFGRSHCAIGHYGRATRTRKWLCDPRRIELFHRKEWSPKRTQIMEKSIRRQPKPFSCFEMGCCSRRDGTNSKNLQRDPWVSNWWMEIICYWTFEPVPQSLLLWCCGGLSIHYFSAYQASSGKQMDDQVRTGQNF